MVNLIHDALMIHYSEGRETNLGKVTNRVRGWPAFCKMVLTPTKTKETRKQFEKLTKDERDGLKATDGYIMAAPVAAGRRRRSAIQPRDLLSLDLDNATPLFCDMLEAGLTPISKYEFVVHSTRSHTSAKPKLRIYAPLSRLIDSDEFIALSRIFAMIMEGQTPMVMTDPVSFRVAQMMFKPTTSIDGEFFGLRNRGALIDPDAILEWFRLNHGDWSDYSLLPRCENETDLRKHAEKAENPLQKEGIVGAFCRTYDVPAAIEKFLPGVYEPVDDWSAKPRYTFMGGTSTSGAVIEDDGLFLYSHHGSDPCADMLVNAFDLVRIHLFGAEDEEADKDTPVGKLPSFKSMVALATADAAVHRQQIEDNYDLAEMFGPADDDDEEDDLADSPIPDQDDTFEDLIGIPVRKPDNVPGAGSPVDPIPQDTPVLKSLRETLKRKTPKPPEDWFQTLETDNRGQLMSSAPNAAAIVFGDKRLHGCLGFNDFTKQIVLLKTMKPGVAITPAIVCKDKVNGDRWQDYNDITLRLLLETPNGGGRKGYGLRVTDRDINAAVNSAARRNIIHPVREYWDACAVAWDGKARVESLPSRYLGVPDDDYHRETIKWMMIASVARIYEPGCKFDYAIILEGKTGIRKSSFIKALYGADWHGELTAKLDNMQAVAEQIGGKLVLELGELSALHKSDFNDAKIFMRRQFDDVRMAYDRRISEFPRQCVTWGSTNDRKYLKDPTGNRSFWPWRVTVEMIDTDGVVAERDQLWGEAVHMYRAMRAAQPFGELPLTLHSREAQKMAHTLQEDARTEDLHEIWAERVSDWLDQPITIRQFLNEIGAQTAGDFEEEAEDDRPILRCVFHRDQAVEFALMRDQGIGDYQVSQNIGRALPLLDGWKQPSADKGSARMRVAGIRRRWWVRAGSTKEEIERGYRFVEAPEDDVLALI